MYWIAFNREFRRRIDERTAAKFRNLQQFADDIKNRQQLIIGLIRFVVDLINEPRPEILVSFAQKCDHQYIKQGCA
jgi:hypothetical protein